jgi:hypothetical protein
MPGFVRSSMAVAIAWGSMAGFFGCGGGDETRSYRLVPVSGTVTLNGKPLEGADVAFIPDAKNAPSTAGSDVTGPDGNYKIMFRGRAGLAPGKYQVVIKKMIVSGSSASLPEEIKADPEMARLAGGAVPAATTKGGTSGPAKTVDATFDREVPPKGDVFDFDVKAKAADVAKASAVAK